MRDTIIVAATGRSGSTWVGEVIAQATGLPMIFEPFLVTDTHQFTCEHPDGRVLRNRSLYIPPDAAEASPYFDIVRDVLRGSAGSETDAIPGSPRLFKEIRANLFLGYLARTWPELKVIWIVRDPYEVIASQLATRRRIGWEFDWSADDVLEQPALMQDVLEPYRETLESAASLQARLACRWCVETLVPHQQARGLKNVLLISYQDLIRGEKAWEPVIEHLKGHPWSMERFRTQREIRSSTSRWLRSRRTTLSWAQSTDISNVLGAFPLEQYVERPAL